MMHLFMAHELTTCVGEAVNTLQRPLFCCCDDYVFADLCFMVVLQCIKEDVDAQIKYAQHIQMITAIIYLTSAQRTVTTAKNITKLPQLIINKPQPPQQTKQPPQYKLGLPKDGL
jgi:hypothetical protein